MINLEKGERLNLDKEAPGLTSVRVGLGWRPRTTTGEKFDLDASVLCCVDGPDGRPVLVNEDGFVFYKHLSNAAGTVQHSGDNRDGSGEGDDETITVDLANLDQAITKIVIAVSIDKADVRRQSFGQVDDAYVKLYNDETGEEILKFDLTEDGSRLTSVKFAELYRRGTGWSFNPVEQGYDSGLRGLLLDHGADA